MDWTDTCVDYLIGGESLNIVGLSGSGRSRGLHMIIEALDPSNWKSLIWTANDLATMTRREMSSVVEGLAGSSRIPVLFIDDYGEFLMERDGPWLERLLFGRVFEGAVDERTSLRCVVVTHPRDREIVSPGSGLRERFTLCASTGRDSHQRTSR